MKQRKTLLTLLLLCSATVLSAQEHMLAVVEQLIQAHPEAKIREEYRCEPFNSNSTYTEKRRDIHIDRSRLTKGEMERLWRAFEAEWACVKQGKAGGARYEMNDSVNCTLIFKDSATIAPPLKNNGYMVLNIGRQLSVTVQKVTLQPGLPAAPDFTSLQEALQTTAQQLKAISTPVRYTGSNGRFLFQRARGTGWTTGTRHVVKNASETHFRLLWNLFDRYMQGGCAVNIIRRNHEVMVKNEAGREFFVTSYNAEKTLSFLLAQVEDQICIPMNWEQIDYFNNGEIKPPSAAHALSKPVTYPPATLTDDQLKSLMQQLETARRKLSQEEKKPGEFDLQELKRNRQRIKALLNSNRIGEKRKQEIRRELELILRD